MVLPYQDLLERLASLPSDRNVEFQLQLTRLVEEQSNIAQPLQTILFEYLQRDKKIAYAAFCALCIYHRRYKNITDYGILIDRNRSHFAANPSFALFDALYFLARSTQESLVASLRSIKQAMALLPNHTGARAAYADIVATAIDFGIPGAHGELPSAKAAIQASIETSPSYAKYPFLLAKLVIHEQDYEGAQRLTRYAIDLEDSSRVTYALRIGEYQKFELDILVRRAVATLDKRFEQVEKSLVTANVELEKAVNETKGQVLAQLGFFAGVLAIILTAVDVTKGQNSATALPILVTISGVIILSWSALSAFVIKMRLRLDNILILATAFLLILFGCWLQFYLLSSNQ